MSAINTRFFLSTGRVARIPNGDTRALVYAPIGRDAQIAASLLKEAGVSSTTVADIASFVADLGDNIAFAVVTEEAFRSADLKGIFA